MKRSLCAWGLVWLGVAPALLHARPEFLARYMADPFARPEKSSCSTCHINPAGGGPRNEFGRAFDAGGRQITASLRQQFPAWFLATKTAQAAGESVKVTWSAAKESESVIQIGEQYYLMNRAEGTVSKISSEQATAFAAPPPPTTAGAPAAVTAEKAKPADDLDSKTLATFDYYLVDLPTNRERPAGELLMRFTHRFDEALTGHTGSIRDLFGFDSQSSVSSFGVEGAVTKWLSLIAYRMPGNGASPTPQRGAQTIELGTQLSLLHQSTKMPFSVSMRMSVEGEDNFTTRYTTNFQPIISHSFGSRVDIMVDPTFSIAVPRRSLTNDFPSVPGEFRDNAGAVGMGGSLRLTPRVAVVAEWFPRIYGFRQFGTSNTYSFGIQRRTNRHVFGLIVTNNSFSTTARTILGAGQDMRIGFNVTRRFW